MEFPATGKIVRNAIFLEFRGKERKAAEGPEARFRSPCWT
jgi:hypothetical protein